MEIEEAKQRARKGPLLLLARRAFGLIISLTSTFTVARLVDPRVYGIANMSLVLLAFAQIFRDFGLTTALMRKGTISNDEINFIFWFNFVTTSALAVVLALFAPVASSFYHEPVVAWVILVGLLGFILEGYTLQYRGLISRDLKFGKVALIESLSLLIGFVVTLTLAAMFHNVWSIVIGNVMQSATLAAGCLLSSTWRPQKPNWNKEYYSVLRFGGNSSIFSISVFLSNNAASILVGHFLGSTPLGFYNRATALFQLPIVNMIEPITQATMPLLARIYHRPGEYRATYVALVSKISALVIPGSAILTICAVPLVELLLGQKWKEAGLVLAALAPALAGYGLSYSAADLFITQNRSRELRVIGLIEMFLRVGAVLIGVQLGLVATALAFSSATVASAAIRLVVVGSSGPVSRLDQLKALLPALPIGIGALAGAYLGKILAIFAGSPSYVAAPLIAILGIITAALFASTFSESRTVVVDLVRTFVPKKAIRG